MSAAHALAKRYRSMAREGLLDVRFDVAGPVTDLETLCSEVESLHRAVEAGLSSPLDFGDASFDRS